MPPLPHYNFAPGTIIEIDGAPYKDVPASVPGRMHLMHCITGQPFLCPDADGVVGLPTPQAFDQLRIDGRAVVRLPESTIAARRIAAATHWDADDCDALDEKSRKRLVQCELLDDAGVKNGVKAIDIGIRKLWTPELAAEHGEPDRPCTIKRWRSERGKPGARTHKLMVSMTGKVPRMPYLDNVSEEIKQKHALRRFSRLGTIASVYDEAVTELREINAGLSPHYAVPAVAHPIFSYDTFRRACIALEGSETCEEQHGGHMMRSTMRGGGKPLTAQRALQKVIIDHTPLDAFLIIDPDREMAARGAWLTVAFDVHSRAALAWTISYRAPSYWTVHETILRMGLPKRPPPAEAARYPILTRLCGRPEEIFVDSGPEFRSQAFENASAGGSFSVTFTKVKAPTNKAIGERGLGVIQHKIVSELPGRAMPIPYSRRAEYDGKELACVTLSELEALANKAFAEYNTEDHEGLDNRQPALVFQKSANRHGIDVMHDMAAFRLEIMDVIENVQISKSGARLFGGLRYHCARNVPLIIDRLLRFEPRRQARDDATVHTKIKYNPENIASVWAWDRSTRTYIELRCADEDYADGMPLWFHKDIKAAAEAEGAAFNTETERQEARTRRIAAIRAIRPQVGQRERDIVGHLYDIPRLRQITGNLVTLEYDYSQAVSADEFIAHDLSSVTSLDAEILAPRAEAAGSKRQRKERDRRDAGQQATTGTDTPTKSSRRRSVGNAGDGK